MRNSFDHTVSMEVTGFFISKAVLQAKLRFCFNSMPLKW
uniref:Uncharacterized protein n=1 Tax=Setaria italica TaxID=4555 RepID=K4A4E9_SETIT